LEWCERPLRFVNRVAGALREVDPSHLITLGSWSFCATTHEVSVKVVNVVNVM
jgi:hypothetical protein